MVVVGRSCMLVNHTSLCGHVIYLPNSRRICMHFMGVRWRTHVFLARLPFFGLSCTFLIHDFSDMFCGLATHVLWQSKL
jgi:hypothetical protein